MTFSTTYSSAIDGWGVVSTPAFANVNSLREKTSSITTISSFIHNGLTGWISAGTPEKDSNITYTWMSNLKKYMLATVETDWYGNITQAGYLLSTGVVGIDDNAVISDRVSVYPNPASDYLKITGIAQNTMVLIFDANGKLVCNKLLTSRQNTLNISDYINGMYFYQIVDMSGQTIDKGKFVVSR